MNFAESCHKFCRNREKRSIGSISLFTRFGRPETEAVSFVWKRLFTWLYKGLYGSFLLGGKPYGTIRQSLLAKGMCAEYSNTSESLWLVPLQGRKMPRNEWKFVFHLFC